MLRDRRIRMRLMRAPFFGETHAFDLCQIRLNFE